MGTTDRATHAPLALRGADLPYGLAALSHPPEALFVSGPWPPAPMVAIVGARAATAYGRAIAQRVAGDLCRMGYVVVSGLARGIDAAAHEGALEAGGVTIAVLPGSLDRISPPAHAGLARRIAVRGALAAEWASGMPPSRGLFIRRNRLIAALALATVVVEAAEQSGALSTAAVARRLGRPVLAVPGDVDRISSRGCLALLRNGARVCAHAGDVVAAIGDGPAGTRAVTPSVSRAVTSSATRAVTSTAISFSNTAVAPHGVPAPPATEAARLAGALDGEPRPLEVLAQRAQLDPGTALALLLELEWAGVAVASPGPRWRSAHA